MSFDKLLDESSDFDLWRFVAQGVFDRRWSLGIQSLTPLQRHAIGAWAASGMIGNRGFCDHSSDEMMEWAAAYDGLGITAAADAIREAAKIRSWINWDIDDPAEQQLDSIEQRYYAADRRTEHVVASLIRERPDEAFARLEQPRSPT